MIYSNFIYGIMQVTNLNMYVYMGNSITNWNNFHDFGTEGGSYLYAWKRSDDLKILVFSKLFNMTEQLT